MDVNTFRAQILQKDERNGYIERERAIDDFLRAGGGELTQAERYVRALEQVLVALSTPVHPDDLLVGRMFEGPLPYELEPVPAGGKSHVHNPFKPTGRSAGHMSLDYTALLRKGLTGIAQEFAVNAHTPAQQAYAGLVDRAVQAIGSYAVRRQMSRPRRRSARPRRDGLHRRAYPHPQLLLALLPPDAGLAPRRHPRRPPRQAGRQREPVARLRLRYHRRDGIAALGRQPAAIPLRRGRAQPSPRTPPGR